jgi:hypothetical protein
MPDKPSQLTAMLLEGPLCLPCLAVKLGSSTSAVEGYLAILGQTISVERKARKCSRCRLVRSTAVLGRPA